MVKTRRTYLRRCLLSTPGPGPVSPPSPHRIDLDPAVSTKGERRSLPNATVMIHQPSGRYNESKLAPVDYELRSMMADLQGTKFLAPNWPMGRPRFPLGSSNRPRRP
ncbi:hypothetical protein ACFX2G_035927 [Malus domestica]